jgi:hypothetical protein
LVAARRRLPARYRHRLRRRAAAGASGLVMSAAKEYGAVRARRADESPIFAIIGAASWHQYFSAAREPRGAIERQSTMHKIIVLLSVSASVALAAATTFAARAEEPVDTTAFAQRLFAVKAVDKKTYACFVRRYDADHLKHHPLQKVSAMKILMTVEKSEEAGSLQYGFQLGVSLRNQPDAFSSGGDCSDAKALPEGGRMMISCSVDCDGGGLYVTLASGDKSVVVDLDQVRIWDVNKPDEDATHSLRAGADDKTFRLDRANVEECTSLVPDHDELEAMRHQ